MLMISFLALLMPLFCEEFSKIMADRFEMSMMEELTYFLGFPIN
jgi:hypothetical protein